jgi:hypothetical protein
MSTNDETVEQAEQPDPIAEAILNANTEAADVVETPAAPESEPVQEAAEELILGKFKSSDDLAEAYRNLEQQFTHNNQRLADLEALFAEDDEEDEPSLAWGAPFTGEPQSEEQLVSWAEKDPGAAAQWAIANSNRVPDEVVNAVWEHWFERKPTEAMAWYTQQQAMQIRSHYEQQLEQVRAEVAPLRDAQTETMFSGAIDSLESVIPDLGDYADKIQQYIDDIPVDQLHLAFFPQGMDTPEKIQEGVKSLYAIVRMREAPLQQQQAQHQQMAQQAFTQSRQGIADTGASDYDARINDAILNA